MQNAKHEHNKTNKVKIGNQVLSMLPKEFPLLTIGLEPTNIIILKDSRHNTSQEMQQTQQSTNNNDTNNNNNNQANLNTNDNNNSNNQNQVKHK